MDKFKKELLAKIKPVFEENKVTKFTTIRKPDGIFLVWKFPPTAVSGLVGLFEVSSRIDELKKEGFLREAPRTTDEEELSALGYQMWEGGEFVAILGPYVRGMRLVKLAP